MTAKLLLMSDIHITEPGTQIIGLDPSARFRRCLDHAAQHHADAAHLFLMGDLTHHGGVSQYKAFKTMPCRSTLPCHAHAGQS